MLILVVLFIAEPEMEDEMWLFYASSTTLEYPIFTWKSGHVVPGSKRMLELERLQFSEEKIETQLRVARFLKSLVLGREEG